MVSGFFPEAATEPGASDVAVAETFCGAGGGAAEGVPPAQACWVSIRPASTAEAAEMRVIRDVIRTVLSLDPRGG
ncbi:hypothetical protein Asp14428_48510 [Actinoplanes sp. NBRC 14428]|nr:hypothetical protein Asp14428_48510 [Actinoplanes sp. NBRC 14428]